MEDAMAAAERGAEGLVVQDVGAAEGEPLLGPLQRKQVRVLAVSWARRHPGRKMSNVILNP